MPDVGLLGFAGSAPTYENVRESTAIRFALRLPSLGKIGAHSRGPAIASLITHPIVPIAAAVCLGRRIVPLPLMLTGVLCAMLPDADSITFALGIPYASPLGHRGAAHSIVFALACAAMLTPFAGKLRSRPLTTFLFCSGSMLSHGMLDAMTTAGLGVEFFWPFDTRRFFFALRPIEVSPISIRRFFMMRAWTVLRSELLWVWLPAIGVMLTGLGVRRWCHRLAR